ncbi:MAG: hypothetical protein ACQEUD_21140 [Bacillota bacterium]
MLFKRGNNLVAGITFGKEPIVNQQKSRCFLFIGLINAVSEGTLAAPPNLPVRFLDTKIPFLDSQPANHPTAELPAKKTNRLVQTLSPLI